MATAVTEAEPITTRQDVGKLLVRLAVGVLLLIHGLAKVRGGVGFIENVLGQHGLPAFIAYGVYVGEVVAPLMLIVGIYTRIAGLIVAFNMVMAILLVQRAKVFALNQSGSAWGIEIEMFFLLTAVAVFFLGSGTYAVSRGRGRWD